ncbi:hypothetical protein EDD18DRAFT_1160092 [Armillaria luteobubalina]|uniref:Secreted protein n=1 Tax=Armillaria luteobubalina TaxID=153913 RepID=A0AA39UQ79_9AGAR|nr:hypothetical protein EDD18DRAFT_1160092 [Armillaria luteobubalina]
MLYQFLWRSANYEKRLSLLTVLLFHMLARLLPGSTRIPSKAQSKGQGPCSFNSAIIITSGALTAKDITDRPV